MYAYLVQRLMLLCIYSVIKTGVGAKRGRGDLILSVLQLQIAMLFFLYSTNFFSFSLFFLNFNMLLFFLFLFNLGTKLYNYYYF